MTGRNGHNDKKENTKKLTLIDLCAGTGAFSYAFESTKKVKTIFC